jgi:FAD:protein FMN transferase
MACEAMATRFEIVLHGLNRAALRAAGEEALEDIQRWDRTLSCYRSDSEIGRVNARAHLEAVRVSPPVFRLLEQARRLHRETEGAFDITVGPLLRCWGLTGGRRAIPTPEALARARECVGMDLVHLDPERGTVSFERPGVMLDLGAIGKGYAVEKAAEILKETDMDSAFLHGGTSTICALGKPPDQETWKVTLELPARFGAALKSVTAASVEQTRPEPAGPGRSEREGASVPVAVVALQNESLSVSAVWGKAFRVQGRTYGHIMDARTGAPAANVLLAAVALPSAAESDGFSTALMSMGDAGHDLIAALRPGARTFTVERQNGRLVWRGRGIQIRASRAF